mmetsp:Transcript_16728/g.45877  ORF Transcript_16728/g.45877 Transcript_16728/m.45877 type:complete len:266 (-) Transcript_16728:537-1334(-)
MRRTLRCLFCSGCCSCGPSLGATRGASFSTGRSLSSRSSPTKLSSKVANCRTEYLRDGKSLGIMSSPCRLMSRKEPKGVSKFPSASGQLDTSKTSMPASPLSLSSLLSPEDADTALSPGTPSSIGDSLRVPEKAVSFRFRWMASCLKFLRAPSMFWSPSTSTRPLSGSATARNKKGSPLRGPLPPLRARGVLPLKSVAHQTITSARASSTMVRHWTGSRSSHSTIRSFCRLYGVMRSSSNSKVATRSSADQAGPMLPLPSSAPTS